MDQRRAQEEARAGLANLGLTTGHECLDAPAINLTHKSYHDCNLNLSNASNRGVDFASPHPSPVEPRGRLLAMYADGDGKTEQ